MAVGPQTTADVEDVELEVVVAAVGGVWDVCTYVRHGRSTNCCRNEYVMVSGIRRARRHMRQLRLPTQHRRSVVPAGSTNEAPDAEHYRRQ